MKFRSFKKFVAMLVVVCMAAGLSVNLAQAKTVTDAHGNVIEIDEALQAYSSVDLKGADNAARAGETNLGDLWTDALYWFAASGKINAYFDEDDIAAGNNGIDKTAAGIVALWNGGNIRSDIEAGTFGSEALVSVLPYPNKVAIVYMTGAELLEALEAASQGLPYSNETADACASFMQISGAEYSVNVSKAYDAGEKYGKCWFTAKSLGRVKITSVNGRFFDEKAIYAVITSNANYNGMDSGYVFKKAVEEHENSTITNAVVRDVVWMYIEQELGNVVPERYSAVQGRIQLVNDDVEVKDEIEYTVMKGDCLWSIARDFYGKGNKWTVIYEANKDKLKNPKVIHKGQKLVIPNINK